MVITVSSASTGEVKAGLSACWLLICSVFCGWSANAAAALFSVALDMGKKRKFVPLVAGCSVCCGVVALTAGEVAAGNAVVAF